jgi:LacI family transcriptional regulator
VADSKRYKAVTVVDVATAAGVSTGTVSKVLNGRGQLRAATRSRVLAAAESLGYSANSLVGGLLGGRTYLVGLVSGDRFGPSTVPVMLGIEDTLASDKMISVLVCDGRGDPIREQYYLRTLLSQRVDGIVVTGRSGDSRPTLGRNVPVPVIYAVARSHDRKDRSFVPDDREGARLAIRHLLSTGRTRIAHVSGPSSHIAMRRRAEGAVSALREAGEELVLGQPLAGEWTERWGRDAANALVRSGEMFDGVFCGSDQIARGLLDGLREAGRRVPDDIGVVGFDNWDALAQASRPPLTTIDLNLPELGRLAATELLNIFDGHPQQNGVLSTACRLVIRDSSESRPGLAGATPEP